MVLYRQNNNYGMTELYLIHKTLLKYDLKCLNI